jgi:hypothetical protein
LRLAKPVIIKDLSWAELNQFTFFRVLEKGCGIAASRCEKRST